MKQHSPDIIMVVETWLDHSLPSEVLQLYGYDVHRADREDRLGGGICVWTKSLFRITDLFIYNQDSNVEGLLLCVEYRDFKCILVTLYFPHGAKMNRSEQTNSCDGITSIIDDFLLKHPQLPIFVSGDFNHVPTTSLQVNYDLNDVVHLPTRGEAFLDRVLVPANFSHYYKDTQTFPPFGSSDHSVILIIPSKTFMPCSVSLFPVLDMRESYLNSAANYLDGFQWKNLLNEGGLNETCDLFYRILHQCLTVFPVDMIKRTCRDKPWISATIKVLINKRYKAFRQKDWSLYKHYRDKVKMEIYNAKRSWSQRLIQDNKSIWDVYRNVKGDVRDKDWLTKASSSTETISNIIEHLNLCYTSNFIDDPITEYQLPFIVPFEFRTDEVHRMLEHVNPRKAAGSDGVPTVLWSKLASSLAEPLCIIFNMCLETASLPSIWKRADITPVPKSCPPNISNTRPISLLPIPEKLFEKRLVHHYKDVFLRHLSKHQFGYRPKCSTVSVVLELENFISNHIQERDVLGCQLVAIDFEKGFDKMSHSILIEKMFSCRFDNFLVSFMQSYLLDRHQRVRWSNSFSVFRSISSGIPQGSVIGPLLFSLFVSDLEKRLCISDDMIVVSYADDFTLCGVIRNSTCPLHVSFTRLKQWASENNMSINLEKCQQMFVTYHKNFDVAPHLLDDVQLCDCIRILGVSFDRKLTWETHTNLMCKKASSKIFILYQLKPFLNKSQLCQVYYSCVRSVLEYCSPIFVNLSSHQTLMIEKVQKRCHRVICSDNYCSCSSFVPLQYRRNIQGFKLFQSIVSDIDHPLHHLVPLTLPYSRKFRLPLCLSAARRNSFFISMARLMNSGFSL